MPKYNGRFVVKDIANGVQYLADLLYQFELGDTLVAPWILGGTVPTIASDGSIRLYDNGAGVGSSLAQYPMANTKGEFLGIIHFKITRKADDTSLDPYALYAGLSADAVGNSGIIFWRNGAANVLGAWNNALPAGSTTLIIVGTLTAEQEYVVDTVITSEQVIFIVDGIRRGAISRSTRGTAPLPTNQNQVWRAGSKMVILYAGHAAGQVSHYRVRDIKVGRLAGIGSV